MERVAWLDHTANISIIAFIVFLSIQNNVNMFSLLASLLAVAGAKHTMSGGWVEYGMNVALVASLVMCIAMSVAKKEPYANASVTSSSQALLDVSSGKIKASKNSIRRITLTQVSIQPKDKTFGQALSNILHPTDTVIFRGRPKYVLKNAIIVGSWIKFEVSGRTVQEAKTSANKRASVELDAIKKTLDTAGLVHSG